NICLGVLAIIFCMFRLARRVPGKASGYLVSAATCVVTVVIAILLPLKQLDGTVPPLAYGKMPLAHLCDALTKDHGVIVFADREAGTNLVTSFTTDRKITRREVLDKLAREANCDLRIGYCAVGSTFLFGSHPSFTR